jgi:hypothetical protein
MALNPNNWNWVDVSKGLYKDPSVHPDFTFQVDTLNPSYFDWVRQGSVPFYPLQYDPWPGGKPAPTDGSDPFWNMSAGAFKPKTQSTSVVIPPNVTSPSPQTNPTYSGFPTGNITMPQMGAGGSGNYSQDLWDSFSRLNAANANNQIISPPTVGGWS